MLIVLIPVLNLLFSRVVQERMGTIILSALVAHTGWHWMTERYGVFIQYDLSRPELTAALIAQWMRYGVALVALAAMLWAVSVYTKRRDDAEATS